MVSSTATLLCVTVTIAYMNNSVMAHKYPLDEQCSVFIEDSEVELYRGLITKATKLVYVHLEYNGTQWDVIKVPDEKSKYLLTLGNYEKYMRFSLHTLSFGIEHTNVTLYTLPIGCLTDADIPVPLSMMLVSNDFKTLCKDRKCLENLYSTATVCIQKEGFAALCTVYNGSDENNVEVLNMPDSKYFSIAIILLFVIILGAVMTISRRFLKFNFLCMLFNSQRIMYVSSDVDDINIVENNNYLIEKQSVPYGILSVLFDIYVPYFFPSVDLLFKSKAPVKSSSCHLSKVSMYVSLLGLLVMFLLFVMVTRSQLLITCSGWMLFAILVVLLVKVCLRPAMIFIGYNSNNSGSILYAFKDCSCVVLIALFTLFLPLIPFYIAFKLITRYERYRLACVGKTFRNWMKLIVALISAFVWLSICLLISTSLTWVTFLTLIGITTNCVPYVPLVMASIVYWQKISARLSNWYSCFFETVLDQVMSMMEEKAFEVMLQSRNNCFLVVKSRSSMQVQGRLLQISGTPIFIDRKGNMKLTKVFFHRCLKISNERLQHNSLRISSDSVRQLVCVNTCLFLIALIINIFGVVGQLPTSYLTLVSLAGGALLFVIDNFIVKDIPVSGIAADKILKCYLEHLVNSYEESFVIENYSQTELIDILCERNKQSKLVSNGCELTTVRSHISPDGHELITVPSNLMTEHIGEEGDTSEMNPLLSLKNV